MDKTFLSAEDYRRIQHRVNKCEDASAGQNKTGIKKAHLISEQKYIEAQTALSKAKEDAEKQRIEIDREDERIKKEEEKHVLEYAKNYAKSQTDKRKQFHLAMQHVDMLKQRERYSEWKQQTEMYSKLRDDLLIESEFERWREIDAKGEEEALVRQAKVAELRKLRDSELAEVREKQKVNNLHKKTACETTAVNARNALSLEEEEFRKERENLRLKAASVCEANKLLIQQKADRKAKENEAEKELSEKMAKDVERRNIIQKREAELAAEKLQSRTKLIEKQYEELNKNKESKPKSLGLEDGVYNFQIGSELNNKQKKQVFEVPKPKVLEKKADSDGNDMCTFMFSEEKNDSKETAKKAAEKELYEYQKKQAEEKVKAEKTKKKNDLEFAKGQLKRLEDEDKEFDRYASEKIREAELIGLNITPLRKVADKKL